MTVGRLQGRSAVITGGSQGLGLAIAEAYVAAGAEVMICGRNGTAVEEAVRKLQASGGRVLGETVDVASRDDVQRLADRALAAFGRVHVLVNNAGVYGPIGAIEEIDWDAWIHAIEVNLLGSVLLCRAFIPHFKQNGGGKIIQLSGGGATNPLPRITAYAASKAAIVRFAESLALELKSFNVDVNSIAPGALNTRLLDEVLAAGAERVGKDFYERSLKQKAQGGSPLQKGADLAVYLASSESDGVTGKLISAIWDPYPAFPEHRGDLEKTDIYTLRRIVPKDRGLTWGSD